MGTEKDYARLVQRTSISTKSQAKPSITKSGHLDDHLMGMESATIPRTLRSSQDALRLQQAHGNQAVMRMVQAKRQGEPNLNTTNAPPNVVARLPQHIQDQVDKIDTKIKIFEGIAAAFGMGQKVVMAPAFVADGIITLIRSIFGSTEKVEKEKGASWTQKIKNFLQFITQNGAITMILNGYTPGGVPINSDVGKIGSFKPLDLKNMPWNVFNWLARPFNWKVRQLKKQKQKLISRGG